MAYWRNTKGPVQLEQNEWHRMKGGNIREKWTRRQALKTIVKD